MAKNIIILICTLLLSYTSGAQTVTVYADSYYRGGAKTFSGDIAWVGNDWNDKISSIKIPYGYKLQVFEDANFQGPSQVFEGDWTVSTSDLVWNDRISSMKLIPISRVNVYHGPPSGVGLVTVFEHANYMGASQTIAESIGWVGNDWNDKISSIKVPRGYSVQIYADANYQGESKIITSDWTVGSDLSWNDKISSIKITVIARKPGMR